MCDFVRVWVVYSRDLVAISCDFCAILVGFRSLLKSFEWYCLDFVWFRVSYSSAAVRTDGIFGSTWCVRTFIVWSYPCTAAAVQQPQQITSSSRLRLSSVGYRTFSRLVGQRSRSVRISGHRQVPSIMSFTQRLQIYQTPSAICRTPAYHTLAPPAASFRTSTTLLLSVNRRYRLSQIITTAEAAVTLIVRGQCVQSPLISPWERQSHSHVCRIQLTTTWPKIRTNISNVAVTHPPWDIWRVFSTLDI